MLPRPEARHQKVFVPFLLRLFVANVIHLLFQSEMSVTSQVSSIKRYISDMSRVVGGRGGS